MPPGLAAGGAGRGRRGSTGGAGRSRKRTALIVGGALVAVAAVAVILTSLGGSSNSKSTATSTAASIRTSTEATHPSHQHAKPTATTAAPATSPAETHVVVLNGTETTGLAHHVSAELQQGGYSQATALGGRPPGANQVTVVEYASGHQADAQAVARSLAVTRVQPLEQTVASLAGSATVVVVVGADKSASIP